MKEFLTFLITSSKDPRKVSLTVRGALTALIPVFLIVSGLSEADANALVDAIVDLVFWVTSIVSTVTVIWGLVRKIRFGRWSAKE